MPEASPIHGAAFRRRRNERDQGSAADRRRRQHAPGGDARRRGDGRALGRARPASRAPCSARWRGREIDKTDGMLLLFDNAADAVAYAMEYHRALASLPTPLAARAGLHVGPVILRENARRRHRPRRQAARGRRPRQADRRPGDGPGPRRPDAAVGRRPRGSRQDARTGWPRTAIGRSRASPSRSSCSRSATPERRASCSRPTARRRIASSGWATGGCRSTRSPNNLPYQATSFIGRERELAEVKAAARPARAC